MIIEKINLLRKTLLLKITNNMSLNSAIFSKDTIKSQPINKILVIRPNHRLGNLILVSALIKELERTFPVAEIDLVTKGGLAKIIYKNYNSIKTIYQLPKYPFKHPIQYLSIYFKIKNKHYDLAINSARDSSSGRIFTNISQAKIKIMGHKTRDNVNEPDDFNHLAKQQIYQLRKHMI